MPALVVHADWSANPEKRWMAMAIKTGQERYSASQPTLVGEPASLIYRLRKIAGEERLILLGFDFPIGLPIAYAEQVGAEDFLTLLPQLGQGKWKNFFSVAKTPEQINLYRPFYPRRPGGSKRSHLVQALGVNEFDDLRRQCDRARPERRAAAPVFWTVGPQQVGKAAISGWKEVLIPAVQNRQTKVLIWPFSGKLEKLLTSTQLVIAETYPAEIYTHLGIEFSPPQVGRTSGKRSQSDRKLNAAGLLAWAKRADIDLTPRLQNAIKSGFGVGTKGEDPFDATVGLFGMLNVVLGFQAHGEPKSQRIRRIEGWILGQPADNQR